MIQTCIDVHRNFIKAVAEPHAFDQKNVGRSFERTVLRKLQLEHQAGVRGIRFEAALRKAVLPIEGFEPGPSRPEALRNLAVRTRSRWAACLDESRMQLIYVPDIECDSVLDDGCWLHTWLHGR